MASRGGAPQSRAGAAAGSLRRPGRAPLARLAAGAAVGLAVVSVSQGLLGFAMQASRGANHKQERGMFRTRNTMPKQNLEIPLEEPEPEPEKKEELPRHRIPYTMHMVTQFPNSKHLHEENTLRHYIERKVVGALENVEELIRHVEVRLSVQENFKTDKPTFAGKKTARMQKHSVAETESMVTSETEEARQMAQETEDLTTQDWTDHDSGTRVLAPYQFKVLISLKNHRTLIWSNPEKHARPTISEATDHMADGIKKLMREEKDRWTQVVRKAREEDDLAGELELESLNAELEADEKAQYAAEIIAQSLEKEDAAMEQFYQKMEAEMGEEDAELERETPSPPAAGDVAAKAAPPAKAREGE